MNDIVVSTWGIGKVYRDRIKHNIRKANSFGYDKVLPYIILTDNPSYFDDLRNEYPDKILKVLNLMVERETHCSWDSSRLEHIVLEEDTIDIW